MSLLIAAEIDKLKTKTPARGPGFSVLDRQFLNRGLGRGRGVS
jgi:hypothetical protein